ncbi:MAG: hypothetical protein KGO82_12420 [Bacteroidota bacterium]|nr:hypothetical protein [Bacteroidota bacterium]
MTAVIGLAICPYYLCTMKIRLAELSGGDRRSLGKSKELASGCMDEHAFESLIRCLWHTDRRVAMRAADVVEKITSDRPELLAAFKNELINLAFHTNAIEIQWHLAQMFPRLHLPANQKTIVTKLLLDWATDTSASRIVRANALESIYELGKKSSVSMAKLLALMDVLEKEDNPSIRARIKKIRKRISGDLSLNESKKMSRH